jgi:hypothetical protein
MTCHVHVDVTALACQPYCIVPRVLDPIFSYRLQVVKRDIGYELPFCSP